MNNPTARLNDIDRQTQALASSIKQSISELALQIIPLNDRYRRLTGEDFMRIDVPTKGGATGKRLGRPPNVKSSEPATPTSKGKRRSRRTTEQLKEQAEQIVAFIRKGGAEGVKGSAIRKEFGQILPSIKEFVKLYGGKAPKTKGEKAGMTYHGE